jgi:hypothetical protein
LYQGKPIETERKKCAIVGRTPPIEENAFQKGGHDDGLVDALVGTVPRVRSGQVSCLIWEVRRVGLS